MGISAVQCCEHCQLGQALPSPVPIDGRDEPLPERELGLPLPWCPDVDVAVNKAAGRHLRNEGVDGSL